MRIKSVEKVETTLTKFDTWNMTGINVFLLNIQTKVIPIFQIFFSYKVIQSHTKAYKAKCQSVCLFVNFALSEITPMKTELKKLQRLKSYRQIKIYTEIRANFLCILAQNFNKLEGPLRVL